MNRCICNPLLCCTGTLNCTGFFLLSDFPHCNPVSHTPRAQGSHKWGNLGSSLLTYNSRYLGMANEDRRLWDLQCLWMTGWFAKNSHILCVNTPNTQHAVLFCNLGTSFICFRAQPQCENIDAVRISGVPGLWNRKWFILRRQRYIQSVTTILVLILKHWITIEVNNFRQSLHWYLSMPFKQNFQTIKLPKSLYSTWLYKLWVMNSTKAPIPPSKQPCTILLEGLEIFLHVITVKMNVQLL